MQISVIQPGARLHYAVPRIFAEAGVLRALHTDLHADHALFRVMDRMFPAAGRSAAVRRLLGRRLPRGLPGRLVRDHPVEMLVRSAAHLAGISGDPAPRLAARLLSDLERSGLGAGDVVYTALINEDIETLSRLKRRGVKIVHECFIAPTVGRIVEAERRRFPGLESPTDPDEIERGIDRDRAKYALADAVIVPSRFVHDAIVEVSGGIAPWMFQVPYGFDTARLSDRASCPQPGRVLFVGSVGLRKGSHVFAAAARALASGGLYQFRAVGPVEARLKQHPLMQGPAYRGQVPRAQVAHEFEAADVFVLPTLCEGMALTHLEALAHGVPVITTPACGSVVTDGFDGLIVPVGDVDALVSAIRRIVEDRAFRAALSRNALQTAAAHGLDGHAVRLFDAMRRIAAS